MSRERTEERLDAMLAALRDRPARLDEITRARVGARLEAALAEATGAAAPGTAGRWRRGVVAAGVGLAAAAAVLAVVAARGRGPAAGETVATGSAVPDGGGAAAMAGSSGAVAGAAPGAPAAPDPAGGVGAPRAAGLAAASTAPGAAPGEIDGAAAGSAAAAVAPIAVAAGDSAQLTLGGAAVTVYGPGRLSPTRDGVIAEAAGLIVDRTHGDTPWTVRYHGIQIVVTRATFAIDRGAETRVTVMRGELELRCPSGSRTIRSGASATCEPPSTSGGPPPRRSPALSPERPPAPESRPAPAPRPAPAAGAPDPYSVAESALRRGDPEAARAALTAIADAAPDSLDAATALLDLARLAASRGDAGAALGYLDRLDRHPRRAALAAPAARLRGTLARPAPLRTPPAP